MSAASPVIRAILLTYGPGAQRRTLIDLRNEGVIGDEVLHRIERDLDLEESRLEI